MLDKGCPTFPILHLFFFNIVQNTFDPPPPPPPLPFEHFVKILGLYDGICSNKGNYEFCHSHYMTLEQMQERHNCLYISFIIRGNKYVTVNTSNSCDNFWILISLTLDKLFADSNLMYLNPHHNHNHNHNHGLTPPPSSPMFKKIAR